MKAFIYKRYGDPEVLQLTEINKPVPLHNEVLVKIHATTVTSADWRLRSLNIPFGFKLIFRLMFGFSKPKHSILGMELAGVVEAVGVTVSKFKVGDAVFAFSDVSMGCYCEYKCLPEDGAIALKPAKLSFEEAAALSFGGTTALSFLTRASIKPGDRLLINGASGSVGTAAIQLAKHFGAEVTAICSSTNLKLVRNLGADYSIDYVKSNFCHNGKKYDLIMDTAGTAGYSRCKDSLKEGGRLLMVLASLPEMLRIPWVSLISDKKLFAGPAVGAAKDLRFLATLAEIGVFKPVIDRTYALEQLVDAHRYVDTGRKKGNVVIRVG
jgi:NADPH:quinone reductase-like Zn-dependent oxidoreductase